MATFITPVQLSSASYTPSTWNTISLAANVPSGTTGVILLLSKPSATDTNDFGLRKTGSTDTFIDSISNGRQRQVLVGLNGSRQFDLYVVDTLATDYDLWLIGYFGSEAVFPTNLVSLGTLNASTFTDVNIASTTGADTATAALIYTNTYNFGCRTNGSTDNFAQDDSSAPHFEVVGCDGSEIFEARDASGGTLYLVGYMTSGITWNTNAIDRSTATTGSFVNITAQAGAAGYVYQCKASAYNETITIRKQGWTIDPYNIVTSLISGQHCTGADAEQKISATTMDVYERGYFTSASVAASLLPPRRPNMGLMLQL